jgi:integrase
MSVYQRERVYWYRFMYRGRVVKRSTRQGNRRVALQMEAEHRSRLAKGEAGLGDKPPCPTLGSFLTERLRPWSEKQVQTTATWYRSGINQLLAYKPLSSRSLDTITSESITDYSAHRQAEGRAAGTVNRELRVLRRVLRLAAEWRVIEKVPKVYMAGRESRRERVVEDHEFARYLAFAPSLLADVAIVLNETGLRPDECHRLAWLDIDFRGNRLFVRHGKTKAARRVIPMTRNVRSVLTARHRAAELPQTGYVFPSATKAGHIDHSTLKKQHRRAIAASGVEPFMLYNLRHTFATKVAPRVDAWTLCKIMGWASLSVAMTYVHPDQQRVLDVFNSCPEFCTTIKEDDFVKTPGLAQTIEAKEGYVVSAAGFEPATHALKGHCSTN